MTNVIVPGPSPVSETGASSPVLLEMVEKLCTRLAAEGIDYCHWKSNEALYKSKNGDNDLDLLVRRRDQGRFLAVLGELGFLRAEMPPAREVPGVAHYYGLDEASGRLVHVHAHFRLVLGDDTTKNFWLPIEDAYLRSSRMEDVFPVPAAEYELAVLVLRLVVKHCTWDSIVQLRGSLAPNEAREVAWLLERTTWEDARAVVAEHLPFLLEVWPQCRRALEPGATLAARVRAARALVAALETCARRPAWKDTTLRLTRRVLWGSRRYVVRRPMRKRLPTGGAVVAVVGGDGSGKSTAVDGLSKWLSKAFIVRRVHLGRPPKSWTTLVVKSGLLAAHRVGLFPDLAEPTAPRADYSRPPSVGWLLWHLMTARDRHRLYVRARRVAAAGGIVLCDRFPLSELRSMDGPRTTWVADLPGVGRFAAALVEREARYYAAFGRPDVLAVLRVDPEIAVARKVTEEEHYVRRRATEVWEATWDEPAAVVDASRPVAEVQARLRRVVWERL